MPADNPELRAKIAEKLFYEELNGQQKWRWTSHDGHALVDTALRALMRVIEDHDKRQAAEVVAWLRKHGTTRNTTGSQYIEGYSDALLWAADSLAYQSGVLGDEIAEELATYQRSTGPEGEQ